VATPRPKNVNEYLEIAETSATELLRQRKGGSAQELLALGQLYATMALAAAIRDSR